MLIQNGFSLEVSPKALARNSNIFYRMGNRQKFEVTLGNANTLPAVCELSVCGVKVGNIRVPAGRMDVTLEGPKDSDEFFFFDKDRTGENANVVEAVFYLGNQPQGKATTEILDLDVEDNDDGTQTIFVKVAAHNGAFATQNERTNDHKRVERKVPALVRIDGSGTTFRLYLVWDDSIVVAGNVSTTMNWNSGTWR